MAILFDEDHLIGTRTWFVPLEGNDGMDFQLVTQQDHEPFMQDALDERNMHDSKAVQKWAGDLHRVASIPMPLWQQLMDLGIATDDKELKKWLNDPDNVVFRTKPGRV